MSSLQLSPQAAANELLRRRSARSNLKSFARFVQVPGAPIDESDDTEEFSPAETPLAAHHELILDAAERCIEQPNGRLMLFMPPGSAKSTYGSVIVPAFAMGRRKGFKVIAVSYGSDLARKMGRRTRSVVKQRAYNVLFDTGLSAESSAADEWALENGSEYMSGGILSGITGNRADLIVVDDPIKGRQDAESETIRKRTIEAFDDDVKTRLKPGGSVIIIQTRWHEEDLAGSILPEGYNGESGLIECRDGQVWEVICLPAKAERADDPLGRKVGEYIWPEWFPESHWAQFERKPRTWASLYQQRPAPEEGDLFRREWLRPYEVAPERSTLMVYGASDYAVTADGGDYTVHIIVGIDAEGRLWLLDLWRGQTSSEQWVESFCDLVLRWKPSWWAEETGQIRAGVGPFLDRRIRERKAYVPREAFPTRGDKAIRAQSIRGRMALDGLYVPKHAPWYSAFESELLTFPTGRNDDQVDAIGLVGQLLDRIHEPMVEKQEKKSTRTDYRPAVDTAEANDWMTY
ncbi:phage terminase large subunit [Pelagibacterium sp. 26DY04]|uniref:phage terminase large subunit n=1 Tax=Pelagibacterium sp. 26DY04 TaxID=2967130 RepID=UPI002814B0EF|nr:phage terminase large subunit [Pelagibacterium sp. 26DY04]WMT88271.1 phage terminase large subunit [Pelagibacterium sp. 26DY04]